MATKFDIRQDDRWFKNTDYTIKFKAWEKDGKTPRDVTGYTLSWMLKRRLSDLDSAAILTKTTSGGITITGTFDSNPVLNTQLIEVLIADTDTVNVKPGVYAHELKRTPGIKTVLCFGSAVLLGSVHVS